MLHVILMILKIIGLILLAIIGLLLLLILIVLLVPIRYKVEAEHGEEVLRVDARVNWFLYILRARISHLEGVIHIRVKIFWITLYDNLKPKQSKEKVAKTKSVKKKTKKTRIKTANTAKTTKTTKTAKTAKTDKTVLINSKGPSDNKIITNTPHDNNENNTSLLLKKEDASKLINKVSLDNQEDETQTIQKTNLKTNIVEPIAEIHLNTEIPIEDIGQAADVKKSFFESFIIKLKSLIGKIKKLKDKIINFFVEFKNKVIEIFTTIANIKQKYDMITDFIRNELNREGFKITYSSLIKILKHILPRKLKSRIVFGTGDPCSTGQALGVFGILYSFYGDKVQIVPDFEKKVLEGKHYARGRIRLVTLLIIVIKLILNKKFKKLKDNFLRLKEAL